MQHLCMGFEGKALAGFCKEEREAFFNKLHREIK